MDTNRSGSITWDEVVSHLLVELAEGTALGPAGGVAGPSPTTELLTDPISALPEVIRSPHRNPIIRITYWPEVSAVGVACSASWRPPQSSHWFTAGRPNVRPFPGPVLQLPAGQLRLGEPRRRCAVLEHGPQARAPRAVQDGYVRERRRNRREREPLVVSVLLKVRPTWVTDLVCMPDVNMMCTSSTERELRFYDTRAGKWELRVLVSLGVERTQYVASSLRLP